MKTILKRIFRSQGGFTLIELLAVLAIISVLAGIVTAAVSGTKGASVESQVKSDGSATASSTDNYNTGSLDSAFPDQKIGSSIRYEATFGVGLGVGVGVTLLDSDGKPQDGGTTLASVVTNSKTGKLDAARTAIRFDATTESYRSDGSIGSSSFVPDYLAQEPSSVKLVGAATRNLDNNNIPEFLWLYAVVSPGGDRENRRTEVYRLKTANCVSALPAGTDQTLITTDLTQTITGLLANFANSNVTLQTAITTQAAAESAVATAQNTLDGSRATLAALLATQNPSLPDSAAVTSAKAAATAAEGALSTAKGTLSTAKTGTATAQVVVRNNVANLTTEQGLRTEAAIVAGVACSGSTPVMNLTYERIF